MLASFCLDGIMLNSFFGGVVYLQVDLMEKEAIFSETDQFVCVFDRELSFVRLFLFMPFSIFQFFLLFIAHDLYI